MNIYFLNMKQNKLNYYLFKTLWLESALLNTLPMIGKQLKLAIYIMSSHSKYCIYHNKMTYHF